MMNKYFKEFLHRGLMFGGFGPIIAGAVYLILQNNVDNFTLSGADVFIAIISTYLLTFLQAGASVFNQIEHWSVMKSLLCHFSIIYIANITCYLVNSWIPFNVNFIVSFTVMFISIYLVIWFVVYFLVKLSSKKLNAKL